MAGVGVVVGRLRELAVMDRSIEIVDRARVPRTVAVLGEPGIGKSHLLTALADRASDRGFVVFSGRAAELAGDIPFGVVVDALDAQVASAAPSLLGELAPHWLPELATALPAFIPRAGDRSPGLQAERYRTHQALRALLEQLAGPAPLLVVLDDLHWADPASVELVAYLLAHPPDGPILLAPAFRPSQAAPRLAEALLAASRDEGTDVLELATLSRAEAAALIAEWDPGGSMDDLFQESGGNPFFLQQLARALHLGPQALGSTPGARSDGAVPAVVRQAVASEVATASEQAVAFLRGAAVAGDPFDVTLAEAAAGLGRSTALAAIDELVARDLVRPIDVPTRFRFRHPILRRAIYDATGAGWRMGAHAAVAAALRGLHAPATAVAPHVERSAAPGDAAAIEALAEAGRASDLRAPEAAAHWFEAALRLLPAGGPPSAQRAGLLMAQAGALSAVGRLDECHRALLLVLQELPPDDPQHVSVVAACASVEVFLGQLAQGRSRLLREIARVGDASPAAAALALELAATEIFATDVPAVRRWSHQALTASRELGMHAVHASAAAMTAYAELNLGCLSAAEQLLEEAGSVFDTLDDSGLAERPEAAHWLVVSEICLEHFEDTVRHCERGIAVARSTGRAQWLVPVMDVMVLALIALGRVPKALALSEEALQAARLAAVTQPLVTALYGRCLALRVAGDVAAAIRTGEEAVEVARSVDENILLALAGEYLAAALADGEEWQRARDSLLSTSGGPDLIRIQPSRRASSYEVLTAAELGLGRVDAAARWASLAGTSADISGLALERTAARRARAAVLAARGDAAGAAEAARAAADAALAAKAPVEWGRSLLLAGRAMARMDDRKRAVALLEQADAQLAACGALGYRDQVTAELRRVGRSGAAWPADERDPVASLTVRERQMADLVSSGRTNRQIAATCYLSEKTVERHLSNIFTKLGVSSRAAVAGIVSRRTSGATV